jgi:hypothetical protein
LDDVRAVIIAARGVTLGPIFFPACCRMPSCCIATGGIALRLDGAAGADGGFEDVSKPDGHHALGAAEVTRLKPKSEN